MDKNAVLKKLKLVPDRENLIVNAPTEFLALISEVNFDTLPDSSKIGKYDFVQVFASSQCEMTNLLKSVFQYGKHDCLFWACYPKSIRKQKYDLNRDTIWSLLALVNLRPVSQIAIEEKWSALRGRNPDLVGK